MLDLCVGSEYMIVCVLPVMEVMGEFYPIFSSMPRHCPIFPHRLPLSAHNIFISSSSWAETNTYQGRSCQPALWTCHQTQPRWSPQLVPWGFCLLTVQRHPLGQPCKFYSTWCVKLSNPSSGLANTEIQNCTKSYHQFLSITANLAACWIWWRHFEDWRP